MYTIAFDADDTLWDNEIFFRESEKKIYNLLSKYISEEKFMQIFYEKEINNISTFGFGVKNLILSGIEAAGIISDNTIPYDYIEKIISIGRDQLNKPVTLLPNVMAVLKTLQNIKQPLNIIIVTKGDLLDQEHKINLSGLRPFFNDTFIMSDKLQSNYSDLIQRLRCSPEEFIMIGNSLKSDALPVLELGCHAIHIPYKTIWQHEVIDPQELAEYQSRFHTVNDIADILPIIEKIINN